MDPRDLTGKVAIITGSSSGLGQAIAVLFAQRGASVTLCGRDQGRLNAAIGECVEASGGHAARFLSVCGDVNDTKVRQDIVDKTVRKFGKLDILVPNAGIALQNTDIRNATEEAYDAIMNTLLKSVFFLIQTALPHLEKSRGNIVNMSSISSSTVISNVPIYPMAKAAMDHMTRSLALDLAPVGIRTNAVNPSYVRTRILRDVCEAPGQMEMVAQWEASNCPLTGECVTAEGVAELVAFLASDAAACITGQCHIIDNCRAVMPPMFYVLKSKN